MDRDKLSIPKLTLGVTAIENEQWRRTDFCAAAFWAAFRKVSANRDVAGTRHFHYELVQLSGTFQAMPQDTPSVARTLSEHIASEGSRML